MDESSDRDAGSRAQLEDREIKDSPYKLIGRCFAAGSFGEIHLTHDTKTGDIYATKLVHKENPNAKLRKEYELYLKLGPAPGLPRVLFFGECDPYDALVMDLLGPSLERVFGSCNQQFSVRTTTQIAVQIVEIIRYIHSQKIIFCNVKPENFCLGRPNTPSANQVHLIGFIHAKMFETEHHEHIPKTRIDRTEKGTIGVFGTPRYMSVNAHKGKELSRRDDLESIGYMLIYFMNGKLPWQGLQLANEFDKYERIYSMKKTIKLEELCAGLPAEYYHYMLCVRTLKFAQEPNYRYFIKMFNKLLHRINMDKGGNQYAVYDWDEQRQRGPPASPTVKLSQEKSMGQQLTPVIPPPPVPTPPAPYRKQVSFKADHESISIQPDLYFPYLRNTTATTIATTLAPGHYNEDSGNRPQTSTDANNVFSSSATTTTITSNNTAANSASSNSSANGQT